MRYFVVKGNYIPWFLSSSGLDSTDTLSFRPITNVSFMSKIIEKIVAYQLTVYLETNKLTSECQSGFWRGHSTETLLLHILPDIYGAVDSSQLTLTGIVQCPYPISKTMEMAGKEEAFSFLRHHTEFPWQQVCPRTTGFNRVQANKFYELLREEFEKEDYSAHEIFNLDESGISTVQNLEKLF